MLKFRTYQVIIHIAGWLLFMALPLLFINGGGRNEHILTLLESPYYWLFCITYISLFYFNGNVLTPALLLKKKYALYYAVILILLAGVFFLKPYDRLLRHTGVYGNFSMPRNPPMRENLTGRFVHPPPAPHGEKSYSDTNGRPMSPDDPSPRFMSGRHGPASRTRFFDSISFFVFLMIVAISTAIKIMQEWQMTEQRAIRAEADKATAELSFLKAQINPHFLFNTLNNIYTLAVMKDDNAPDSILKLSNIMRYVTDDAMADFVTLQSEIDCINDYIELQRLRLGEKTKVNFDVSGDIENKKIPPLILMTFVENVFKYGISKHHKSDIIIKLKGDYNGISFFCQNSIFPEKDEKRRVGIGLKNTQQRLAHVYPGKHVLDINTDNKLYTVKLMLQTS